MAVLVRVTGGGGIQIYDVEIFTQGTDIGVETIKEEYRTETGYEAESPIHFLEVDGVDGGELRNWIAVGESE